MPSSIPDEFIKIEFRLKKILAGFVDYNSLDLSEERPLAKKLQFYLEIGGFEEMIHTLGVKCVPIIEEIREKNISLFENIQSVSSAQMYSKLMYTQADPKYFDYLSSKQPCYRINPVTEEIKHKWFSYYLNELEAYETIFNKVSDIRFAGQKKFIRPLSINTTQATKLYELKLTGERPNISFINSAQSPNIATFQKLLSIPTTITNEKFHLNCQNEYAAFIFNWLEIRLKRQSVFTWVEDISIFYTRAKHVKLRENHLTAGRIELENADDSILFEKIITGKNTTNKTRLYLNGNSSPIEILNYLHQNLCTIFL